VRESLGQKGSRRSVRAFPRWSLAELGYNDLKRGHQLVTGIMLRRQWRPAEPFAVPVVLSFDYHEKDRHRDKDGVSSGARKIILDAMVDVGMLPTDGNRHVWGFGPERFFYDGDEGYRGSGVDVEVAGRASVAPPRRFWLPARLPDFNELREAIEVGVRRQLRKGNP